ncbi:hypothetical protein VTN00DRAFT_6765 [Thermoascus crustaceus]|uniref:uncharacterized protein n=1 Tax=Thermoascus crustaceus TaxID=5088 RepID=UPI00374490AD
MEPVRASRFLDPAVMAITKQKAEAMRLAREQGAAIKEMCRRAKTDSPPYEFDELIGKGAYGRVYKGRQLPSGKLVAIKVMDIDTVDYKSIRDMKDESIKDFIHETKVMQQVKDAGAKNINMLIEAISIHSQLWLVCEYCPGGSVKTLMRATGDKLEERFIIPIARELAEGLRAIHDAGIIHRDVKAANILIHEEGRLQICDFGVAGILQSKLDKRSTWIGTPHWMPPEMFSNRGGGAHQYGSEIDVWAFGCTLYEFATGNPPNANLRERMQIGRQLNRVAPRLEGEGYSEGLKDLVSFSLNTEPQTRPSMGDILAHPYIHNSADGYPTSSLSDLVRIYYQWAQRGGQRISLFNPGGAAAAEFPGDNNSLDEDWNFSTTDGFEKRYSVIDLDQLSASLADIEREIQPTTKPRQLGPFDDSPVAELTPEEKANFDERVKRGAAAMEGLFNEDMPSYKYETKNDFVPVEQKRRYSDLPLRTDTDRSSVTSTFIDLNLGAFDSSHYAAGSASNQPFQLADADTIRANRSSGRLYRTSSEEHSRTRGSDAGSDSQVNDVYQPQSGPRPPTMDWKFPAFMLPPKEVDNDKNESQRDEDGDKVASSQDAQNDKRATMEWTFPVMTEEPESTTRTEAQDDLAATIRASQPPATHVRDSSIGEPGDSESRPSTAVSTLSTASDTEYDPFRFDRPQTPPGDSAQHGHFFDNELPTMMDSAGYGDYEPSSVLDGPGPDQEDDHPAWQDNNSITDVPSYVEPLPSTLPSKNANVKAPTSIPPVTSLPPQSIPTARRAPTSTTKGSVPPVNFPNIQPPSAESLTAGADDSVVASELDRLLGDFLGAISAVGEAIGSVNVEPGSQNGNVADNSRSE